MIEIVNLGEMFDYRDHANRHDTRDMMASELGEWLHCNHFPGSTYRLGERRFYHENFVWYWNANFRLFSGFGELKVNFWLSSYNQLSQKLASDPLN